MKKHRIWIAWLMTIIMLFGSVQMTFAASEDLGAAYAGGDSVSVENTENLPDSSGGSAAQDEMQSKEDSQQQSAKEQKAASGSEKATAQESQAAAALSNDAEGAAKAGTFVLTAINEDDVIIKPVQIKYSKGDTVKSALEKSGYRFGGLDKGFITSIEGHKSDSYMRFYDENGWDLEEAADKITAMVFTTRDDAYSVNYLSLVKALESYTRFDSSKKNYDAIKSAYENGIKGLPKATSSSAASLIKEFENACKEYEDWLKEPAYPVTIHPEQDGSKVEATVEITGGKGISETKSGSDVQFSLREGSYNFKVTKDNNETTGSFKVTKDGTSDLNVDLFSGNMFGEISFYEAHASKTAYPTEEVNGKTVVYIPDDLLNPTWTVQAGEAVPDAQKADYKVYKDYTAIGFGTYYGDESKASNKVSWGSKGSFTQAFRCGLGSADRNIKVVYQNSKGYTQRQYHTITLIRVPQLRSLEVKENGAALRLDFTKTNTSYSITTASDELEIGGSCLGSDGVSGEYGSYASGYSITVNGEQMPEGGTVKVPVKNGDTIKVAASGEGQETVYEIKVTKVAAVQMTLKKDSDVALDLYNATNAVVKPASQTDTEVTYNLSPGSYTWIGTKETYYHVKGTFGIQPGMPGRSIDVPTPEKEQYLTSLEGWDSTSNKAVQYQEASGKKFDWKDHEYTYVVPDAKAQLSVWAVRNSTASTITRESYLNLSTNKMMNAKSSTSVTVKQSLTNFVQKGGRNNSVDLTVSKAAVNGVTYYQHYTVKSARSLSLGSLETKDAAGKVCALTQSDGKTTGFSAEVSDYSIKVSQKDTKATVSFSFPGTKFKNSVTGQYTVDLNGEKIQRTDDNETVTREITLDPSKAEETISLKVSHEDASNIGKTYKIVVHKVPPAVTKFKLDPEDATVVVTDDSSNERVWPEEDGSWSLKQGSKYTWSATAYGYVSQTQSFTAEKSGTIDIKLKKAEVNKEIDKDIKAEWPYFRADENNNGVIDAKVPTKAEDTVLYWATKLGDGYGANATGCPILADGYLYTYAGKYILKVDPMTGKVEASGEMKGGSSFAINSPTYAEGMIFVGLSNGAVQAFNAKTLDSLWIYHAPLGGQPNCPITYCNGYIYTGFWQGETKPANFVCLSVTDEDPNDPYEEKTATWVHEDKGFYWAGAYASKDFVIIGTDDGADGYTEGDGDLLSMDPKTGKVIDILKGVVGGDIRSSVCYDTKTNRYYFTSKGGWFCSVEVNPDGTFNHDTVKKLYLDNYSDEKNCPPMSTCTPVIHNGRAYIGVSGTSQFGAYSGHNITVIDLETMTIAYKVRTKGYPQTSGLLTTAYDEGDGTVYVYFFDNFTPGQLRVIKDKPGQTEPDSTVKESDGKDNVYDTANTLFTPFGDQAQYAICSPIADEWGNLYFKNDSAYMMMIGAVIKKLEVTTKPDKVGYKVGDTFDPTGMVVTATYANGKKRDVTKYIKYTTEKLTAEDTEIDLVFDLGENQKMYQDKDGQKGTPYVTPPTSVSISVAQGECQEHKWDEGKVTKKPTYKENGVRHYYCTVCGAEKDEAIPAQLMSSEEILVPGVPSGNKLSVGMNKAQQNEAVSLLKDALRANVNKSLADKIVEAKDADENAKTVLQLKADTVGKKDIQTDESNILTAADQIKEDLKARSAKPISYMRIATDCTVNGKSIGSLNALPSGKAFDMTISIPKALWSNGTEYRIVKVGTNGKTSVLDAVKNSDHTVSFSADGFGTYALIAVDKSTAGSNTGKTSNTLQTSSMKGSAGSGLAAGGSTKAGSTVTAAKANNTAKKVQKTDPVKPVKKASTQKDTNTDWSLLNLILLALTLAMCIVMLTALARKHPTGRQKYMRILSLVPAAAAVAMFILTQNIRGHMGYIDAHTMYMGIIFLAQIMVSIFAKMERVSDQDDDMSDWDDL